MENSRMCAVPGRVTQGRKAERSLSHTMCFCHHDGCMSARHFRSSPCFERTDARATALTRMERWNRLLVLLKLGLNILCEPHMRGEDQTSK